MGEELLVVEEEIEVSTTKKEKDPSSSKKKTTKMSTKYKNKDYSNDDDDDEKKERKRKRNGKKTKNAKKEKIKNCEITDSTDYIGDLSNEDYITSLKDEEPSSAPRQKPRRLSFNNNSFGGNNSDSFSIGPDDLEKYGYETSKISGRSQQRQRRRSSLRRR